MGSTPITSTNLNYIGGIFGSWLLLSKERGETTANLTGKNNAFSVNFGPVAQTAAPKAMVAFA